MTFDLTATIWQRKRRIYTSLPSRSFVLSTPSAWLKEVVNSSPLTRHLTAEALANGVPLDTFKPLDRPSIRAELGISKDENVIMFSFNSKNDSWLKGADLLPHTLGLLSPEARYGLVLLLVGGTGHLEFDFPVRVLRTGHVNSENEMVRYYNAADVFLNLSRADNLPNCLVEACACGLPVITLDAGGCHETVEHAKTGFVADSIPSAARLLESVLRNRALRNALSLASRRFAEAQFSVADHAANIVAISRRLQEGSARVA